MGIGTIEESFQLVKKVEIDMLELANWGSNILSAVASITCQRSCLDHLILIIVCSGCRTLSSVHSRSSIVLGLTSDSLISDDTSG